MENVMATFCNLKNEIYLRIKELSDITIQKKLWLNQDNNTGEISSYAELMCTLYDDLDFHSFAKKGLIAVKNVEITDGKMSKALLKELQVLDNMLQTYNSPGDDGSVLVDSAWQKITHHASVVVNLWDKDYSLSN